MNTKMKAKTATDQIGTAASTQQLPSPQRDAEPDGTGSSVSLGRTGRKVTSAFRKRIAAGRHIQEAYLTQILKLYDHLRKARDSGVWRAGGYVTFDQFLQHKLAIAPELFDAIDRGITSQGRVFAKTRAFADLALKISGLA